MVDSVYLTEDNIFYRWSFSIEIRESFNYRLYPFDRNDLWLRLWHVNFDKNVVLIPDLNSYRLFHPSYKPGIDNSIIIPGWEIDGSYFSFKEKNYNTDFGSEHHIMKKTFPELHFNIMLKRNYIDPIITRIIPLVVLVLMAYSILLLAKKGDELNIAIACSGLLFIAVFEQVNIRRTLDTSGIIYLEYFYFITYILLMLVAINYYINREVNKLKFCKNENVLKMVYWPIALMLILLTTLYTFY